MDKTARHVGWIGPVDAVAVADRVDVLPDAAVARRLVVDGKYFARHGRRVRLHGVTYGPFAPNAAGEPFPSVHQVRDDFERMDAIGVNTIRTYHLPPEWLLDVADEQGVSIFVDVPWPKHLCFLDDKQTRHDAHRRVREAATRGCRHPALAAYSIGNELPANIVRWHGARRIERFLAELCDTARQADPQGLVTYASFPPTEYLELPFLDFATFNVYLHDRPTFRRYLFRLQNLVGDRPLVLGELGMDTLRHGELEQAEFLAGHLREASLMGLAGAFVFSWTDDWHTGGHAITDWAFGIVHRDRLPKASYHALRDVFDASLAALLSETPRVSVVVCTYNGGATLEQCLHSLCALGYPDYEIIVVDDGSTDNTRNILARFPTIRVIHQANYGLSVARNVGLRAATGAIVAYTDSDCFADANWLTYLAHQFAQCDAAAVGGPNLTPEDGWLAGCVAAAPGQPTHVLESDQVAEHIPGCNMAFRRAALEAINGFDAQYRKAGDDVDVCWRLQHAGYWITYAPGAFVWHHRRQTPRAYLRQQAGYGEAEALLQFKHPDRFTGRGDGKWRGVLYGASLRGICLGRDMIYRGTFGTGLFQCLYQPGAAHWAMLPSTLEWHVAAGLVAATALLWWPAWVVLGIMLALSLAVAAAQAVQAVLAAPHRSIRARLLVMALCYLQPLVRSWARYRTRLFSYGYPVTSPIAAESSAVGVSIRGRRRLAYWSEGNQERTELLESVIATLMDRRWGVTVDSGWADWDVEVHYHPWTQLQIATAQEDHGAGKRLIRVRYRMRPTELSRIAGGLALAAATAGAVFHPIAGAVGLGLCVLAGLGAWWRGTRLASHAVQAVDSLARRMNLFPVSGHTKEQP